MPKLLDLSTYVSRETLKKVLNSFAVATGLRVVIVDLEGNQVLVPDGFESGCRFCQVIQGHATGALRCRNSYAQAGMQAAKLGDPYIFRCHVGLVSWITPITLQEEHLASIICGQVLMWEPEEFFWTEIIELNNSFGIDLPKLIAAGRELKTVTGDYVQAAADMLNIVANYIIETGMIILRQRQEIYQQQTLLNKEISRRKALESATGTFEDEGSYAQKERVLLTKIQLGDSAGAENMLIKILVDLLVEQDTDLETMKARSLELLVLISRAAVDGGADQNDIARVEYENVNRLLKCQSVEELNNVIVNAARDNVYFVIENKDLHHENIVISTVMLYVKKNYAKELTLEDIAQQVYISQFYLSRVFKRIKGLTVIEYLTQVRVEKAQKLLRSSTASIEEIALATGFSDGGYFSKVFKKQTDMTPSMFRQYTNAKRPE